MNSIGQGYEIYILDDNETDIMIAKRSFDRCHFTNNWRKFLSGDELCAHMKTIRDEQKPVPELILTDINMPQMNGFQVVQSIRSFPEFKDRPLFYMLTNSDSEGDRRSASNVGANGYIVKPNSISEYVKLFKKIADQLQTSST